MEGSGEGSAGCAVDVDVHGKCYVVGGCNVVATEHSRYSLSCMQRLCSSAGSVWYVGSFKLRCEIIAAECGRYGLSFMWKTVD